jgi:hypothetical protein
MTNVVSPVARLLAFSGSIATDPMIPPFLENWQSKERAQLIVESGAVEPSIFLGSWAYLVLLLPRLTITRFIAENSKVANTINPVESGAIKPR